MYVCDPRTHAVQTTVFDGPLELLLCLVRDEGLDLCELSIAPLADAFLNQIERMESIDLDRASEFLLMAATLCWLKIRELSPNTTRLFDVDERDPEQVRMDLTRRLRHFRRYRDAADALAARPWLGRDTFCRIQPPRCPRGRRIDPGVDPIGLLQIFEGLLKKREERSRPSITIKNEYKPIEDMAAWVVDQVAGGRRDLHDLFNLLGRSEDRVMALLATLELTQTGALQVQQEEHLGPIVLIARQSTSDADISARFGSSA